MIITCPSCEAQYILPDQSIGPKGRRVKCTSCAFVWLQPPAADTALDAPIASTIKAEKPAPSAQTDKTNISVAGIVKPALFGTGAALALIVLTFGFLFLTRDEVVVGWPSSIALFDALGADVAAAGAGLALSDVKVDMFPDKTPPLMTFRGSIKNTTDRPIALPKMTVMNAGDGGVLKDWSIDLYGKKLGAGESVAFDYTLQDAPDGTRDVTVRFSH